MADERKRVLVAGAGGQIQPDEAAAATLLGGLLAREGYDLISGTWGGVDEQVTRSFLAAVPAHEQPSRIVHIENHSLHSQHHIRVGRVIPSSAAVAYSDEAVALADVGIIVSGRSGSKPTVDALSRLDKPVIPLAWLGHDAFDCLQDLLREIGASNASRGGKRLLLSLIDPACGADETLSRVLGACLAPIHQIFISYHRRDCGPDAGRLATQLAGLYGTRRVFIDYESLPAAEYIETVISKAGSCRLLVALLGPAFLDRVKDEHDYVRREILAAVEHGATLLPVLVDCALPDLDRLPPPLRVLRERNAIRLDRARWNAFMHPIEKAADLALQVTRMKQHVSPY